MMTVTATRPVGVDELKRAWRAVQDGQFRDAPARPRPVSDEVVPRLGGPVLPVVGASAQAGTTTVALALATVAGSARLIECSEATGSGLAAAATAELGVTESGWALGRRGDVLLARRTASRPLVHAESDQPEIPDWMPPWPDEAEPGSSLTVLDLGLAARASAVVVVGAATVPGLRRLETALALLGPDPAVAAVRGPAMRRWPRELRAAMGPLATERQRTGRWVAVPHDKRLALRGIDSLPLPASVLAAARDLLDLVHVEKEKS